MSDDKKYALVKDTAAIVFKDFDLEHSQQELSKNDKAAYKALRKRLAREIQRLIEEDVEKLLAILYRIDVDETKSHRILSEKNPREIPFLLADLVIEREMQKALTRKLYREDKLY